MNRIRGGYLLVVAAAILWGTTGTAQAIGHPAAQPAAVGALRLVIAAVSLLTVSLLRRALPRPRRSDLPWMAAGAALVLLFQLTFFASVRTIGVAAGTMLQIGSAPIAASLLGAFFLRESVSRRSAAAIAVGIAGITLATLGGGSVLPVAGGSLHYVAGALLAITAGIAYTGFSLCLRQLSGTMSALAAATWIFSLGGLVALPVALAQDLSWLVTARGGIPVIYLGTIATALAYILFTRGIRQVHFASAITATLIEGVTAALLGTLLLRERPASAQIVGMLLVISAVWMSGTSKQREGRFGRTGR